MDIIIGVISEKRLLYQEAVELKDGFAFLWQDVRSNPLKKM